MIRTMLGFSAGLLSVAVGCACSSSLPRAAPMAAPSSAPPPGRVVEVDGSQSDVDDAMRKRGYKPATLKGERVYCRNEVMTGSNLESKICLTKGQIDEAQRAGRDVLIGARPAGGCQMEQGCTK